MEYIERFYREYYHVDEFLRITLIEGESDLEILMEKPAIERIKSHEDSIGKKEFHWESAIRNGLSQELKRLREQLVSHMKKDTMFFESLVPLQKDESCEPWIQSMYEASAIANVGPMACVAGIIAQEMGAFITKTFGNVDYLIENGGDLFISTKKERLIQVFAGESILSNKIKFKVFPEQSPIGICTSAGTIGHSLSFGIADAVVVISKDNALADAVATRLGNEVTSADKVEHAIHIGATLDGVEGILIIQGEHLGIWGKIELV